MADTYAASLMHVDWLRWFEKVKTTLESVGLSAATNAAGPFVINGTATPSFPNAQPLGLLSTGLVKNTTSTGILSIGVAAVDYVAPSAYASVNGLTMATARLLGRTTAGTGAAQEISVAGNLTLSAGVLTGTAPAGAALTKTDDTNVTLALGGSPTVALLAATSLTLGWTGTLSPTRGGLGFNASGVQLGGLISGTGAGTFGIAAVGVNGRFLIADNSVAAGIRWAGGDTTTSTTGNIDDFDFGIATLLRFTNASLTTLRGLKAGSDGQILTIVSAGAGQVNLANQNAGSAAANRLTNFVSGDTPLVAGIGTAIYQYDTTSTTWRLIAVTGSGTTGTFPKWASSVTLGDSVLVESSGNIGTGGTPTSKFHAQSTADEAVQIQAQNTNASGTTASASMRAAGDVAQAVFIAHGSGRVVARCGITLGGWSEIFGGTSGNGMLIDLGAGAGPLVFGTNNTEALRIDTSQTLVMVGSISKYRNVTTAGWGVPAIQASARSLAQIAAVASVAAYTVGVADGSFLVSANVNVTTSTTHNFAVQVDYTDETNAARTLTLNLSSLAGAFVTAITNVTGAGPYEGVPLHIRCKASTAITIKTTGTFTTVTYNVEGLIQQVA